ncbi:sodium:solute symporter family protein [Psychrobacillus psychrodurans]|uniref:sodium:solute symporter family protein n=1 Tax=Psychrobacillus psychrodurans TaxID=126157 RepID=UPI0008E25AE5|nr:pantothenate permease [Psychrobacillus psychrodurans]MCZ8542004.1 sodium:solute symporter family protein [Psychrobacillus psychrodurans]SFN00650.1 Na+/proline symporter [Psychrobacillus psychrodurans]
MGLSFWTWTLTIVLSLFFIGMSFFFKKKADASFAHYAIAGGSLPFFLLLFTDIATIMGVGNFVGHSSKGYEIGIANIPFVVGEQGAKILFALVFAGFAAKFTYKTLAEMINDLIVRDRITRSLVALLTSSIMIAWVSGQAMGMGALFSTFTGADPILMILVFSAVFIIYTAVGGMYSVVWTDLIQGGILIAIAVWFYFQVFDRIDFSYTNLKTGLAEVGSSELVQMNLSVMEVVTLFVTGTLGILAAQVYWQRCFASKSSKSASRAMLISGIVAIIFTTLATVSGLVVKLQNPTLDADNAISWLILEEMTQLAALAFFIMIFMAAISSASSLLHSAAVVIINDLVIPNIKEKTDLFYLKLTRVSVVVFGILTIVTAIWADSIIDLFSLAYSMAGGGVVPVLIVGLIWKSKRNSTFEMGMKNSQVSVWGARIGIISGAIVSLILGVLWGVLASVILTILFSKILPSEDIMIGLREMS